MQIIQIKKTQPTKASCFGATCSFLPLKSKFYLQCCAQNKPKSNEHTYYKKLKKIQNLISHFHL